MTATLFTSCRPRADILAGLFNPEIFTASLSQVIDFYRGKPVSTHSLYTDAAQFFRFATYPTQGLKSVALEVLSRLKGEANAPAIHRLETAFGGGKTHALIALTHFAHKGSELAPFTGNIVSADLLPSPGEVNVVGIAGDELPVVKPQGSGLLPYTLWGEIASHLGGDSLYKALGAEATAFAAPSKAFLEKVFSGRKVLLMLDELAQYATRLEGARAGGGDQLASFLMTLLGYARSHTGLSIVITLSGSADAFGAQAKRLGDLLTQATGKEFDEASALGIAQRATASVTSVVARDATTIVPVQAGEIARVLACRLFEEIDLAAARTTVAEYAQMYGRNASLLPEQAVRNDHAERMLAHYPFHPSLIDFLNQKLATVQTFQGTRGVLRVLSLVVRNLWAKRGQVPMIHTCHIDLSEPRIVNELLGRTANGHLLPVLNADIGGPDTGTLETGQSRAQFRDRKNPHPEGHPLHVYAWRTVFLHSLAGLSEGLASNVFGITERDALLETAFPGMTPPMVQAALGAIRNEAYYLREKDGRFYASTDPSVNRALADIRKNISDEKCIELIAATARKVVRSEAGSFRVIHDVIAPEGVLDQDGSPCLAMLHFTGDDVDIEAFITQVGESKPRKRQNLVLLLLPAVAKVKGEVWPEEKTLRARELSERVKDFARDVLARRRLKEKPENFGIRAEHLKDEDFEPVLRERELAVQTEVQRLYDTLWFASASGQIVKKEIRAAAAESGAPLLQKLREALEKDGELITSQNATTRESLISLNQFFFADSSETVSIAKLRENFFCLRHWPVLEKPELLEQIVRAGVAQGMWCLFRMGDAESTKPAEFFSRDSELPMSIDLSQPAWSLVTPIGAKQRGWGEDEADPKAVEQWVFDLIKEAGAVNIPDLVGEINARHGEVPENKVIEATEDLVKQGRLMAYPGKAEQAERPTDLVSGGNAALKQMTSEYAVVTKAKAAERGWTDGGSPKNIFRVEDGELVPRLMPILGTLGSLYLRGAKSAIANLDIWDLNLEQGGKLRLSLTDVSPDSMKRLQELFETLALVVKAGRDTSGALEINEPDETCPLIKALRST